ncbi:MAG: glycosyltransferase [Brevundimonas sp.]
MPGRSNRKLLFHYPVLNVGGAEMSTLRLLSALADRDWEITLVLTTGGGTLEDAVDPRVRLVRLRPLAMGHRFAAARGAGRLAALTDLLGYALMRFIGILRMVPFLFRRYAAAAVLLHSTSPFFVARVVRADVRLHWIRNDLKGVDPDGRLAALLRRYLDRIDAFVCVSGTARDSLLDAIPEAAGKVHVVYNILNTAAMQARLDAATDPFPATKPGTLRLLTVCRLQDRDKAIFRMVRVCKALVDRGLDFVWYVVGDGAHRAQMETQIDSLGLGQRMILLGEMRDPFPAYKYADLVAVLSYHEGLCGVINEAKVSGRAVVATHMSGVLEQISHGRNGWIVDNDEESIIAGMHHLISQPDLVRALQNHDYPEAILDDQRKILSIEHLIESSSNRHRAG